MVDIVRPAYGEAWASVGEKVSPTLTKIQGGWIQEMMPYQWENFLQNRQDTALLYMLQKGVPEWDASQEYIAGKSVVTYQTNLYISVLDSTNVLPTVQTSWKKLNPSTSSSGVVTIAGGGTGAGTAVDARTNLGLGTIATATAPTSNGVVVRSTADTLISRSVTGTANNIVVTNGDGVAGNININAGSNVALLNTDSSWTSTGSIRLPSGSTSQQGASTPGRVRFNLETDEFHGAYSDGWKVLAKPASAEQTPITDVGNFYTSSNVEGALQEVGLEASFVKDAILSYPDYAAASAAAATLPDGQRVKIEVDETRENRHTNYVVQSGALVFVDYALDAIRLQSYAALRAYTGKALAVDISTPGIDGRFTRDDTDTTSADNGGTIIVDGAGRRWKRVFFGPVNVMWFGAVADEVTDCTAAIQAAVNVAGLLRGAVYLPAGRYRTTSSITSAWPLNMHGDGGQVFTKPQYVSTAIQGSTIVYEGTADFALKVNCPPYTPGLSLRDFSIIGKEGANAYGGLFLNETGWTGLVQGVTIDNFVNEGLLVDYIQDTHFIGFTIMRCGKTAAHPAIRFIRNSNFIYFTNCRFELCNYMINGSNAFVVHWRDCHIESGSYGNPDTNPYESRYTSSPVVIGDGANDWHFDGCIFGPVSIDSLVATNGGNRLNQPHYITVSSGAFNINFNSPTVSAPQNAVDFLYSVGTGVHIRGGNFYNLNPERFSVYIKDGSITGGTTFGLYGGWNGASAYGVQIDTGIISDFKIGYGSSSTITTGALIDSGVYDGLKMCNVNFASGMDLPCWVGANVNVSGQPDSKDLLTVNGSISINFARIKPGVHVRLNAATVTDATGCQVGRRVRFINDSGSSTINHNGSSITTEGGAPLSVGYFTQYEFVNTQAYGLRQIG